MIVIKRCIHAHMCSVYMQCMTYVTHTHTAVATPPPSATVTAAACFAHTHTDVHLPRLPLHYWAVIAFLAHCTPRARLLSVLHTLSLSPHSTRCAQVPACLIAADRTFFLSLAFLLFRNSLACFFFYFTHTHTQTDINVALRSNYASPSYFAFGSTKKTHTHTFEPQLVSASNTTIRLVCNY